MPCFANEQTAYSLRQQYWAGHPYATVDGIADKRSEYITSAAVISIYPLQRMGRTLLAKIAVGETGYVLGLH
jgi:hypothetical protein